MTDHDYDYLTQVTINPGRPRIIKSKHGTTKGQELFRERYVAASGMDKDDVYQPFTVGLATSVDRGKSWIWVNYVTGKAEPNLTAKELKTRLDRLAEHRYTKIDAVNARKRRSGKWAEQQEGQNDTHSD